MKEITGLVYDMDGLNCVRVIVEETNQNTNYNYLIR